MPTRELAAAITLSVLALVPATAAQERPPAGGGPWEPARERCIGEEEYAALNAAADRNLAELARQGRIPPVQAPAVSLLDYPLSPAPGYPATAVDFAGNYVDHNPAFPNMLLDWNCGARTYDLASGYNHTGIDIGLFPFRWRTMDRGEAQVRAAEPGVIIVKQDGFNDRNCAFTSDPANAIIVQHADGSEAWYWHMKRFSLTAKGVGDSVAAGELLGLVGSSGSSTAPHLHFEVHSSRNGPLIDPHPGACNTAYYDPNLVWAVPQAYRQPRINRLGTHTAVPDLTSACPDPQPEAAALSSTFPPSGQLYTAIYLRDALAGARVDLSLVLPGGATWQSWSFDLPGTFSTAWYYWGPWNLPAGPTGGWKFRAVYQGVTTEQDFAILSATDPLFRDGFDTA